MSAPVFPESHLDLLGAQVATFATIDDDDLPQLTRGLVRRRRRPAQALAEHVAAQDAEHRQAAAMQPAHSRPGDSVPLSRGARPCSRRAGRRLCVRPESRGEVRRRSPGSRRAGRQARRRHDRARQDLPGRHARLALAGRDRRCAGPPPRGGAYLHQVKLVLVLPLAVVWLAVPAAARPDEVRWSALRRPLHLPVVAPGAPCPVSKVDRRVPWSRIRIFGSAGIGPGPVYPGLGATSGLLNAVKDTQYGGPWQGQKVFWYVAPAYRDRVLIRGRRLTGLVGSASTAPVCRRMSCESSPSTP